jgi:hypothetical protein
MTVGNFYGIGDRGEWWSSLEDTVTGKVKSLLNYCVSLSWESSDKINGESVRCIKD